MGPMGAVASPGRHVMNAEGDYPRRGGRLRRLIDLTRRDERTVVGWLEDDFHHFGVTIVHDASHVVNVAMAAPRRPYTTCAGAGLPLRALIGAPLLARASDIGRWIDMRLQCTHVFDLAGLTLAHAWAGRAHRRYEATVEDRENLGSDPVEGRRLGPGKAELLLNGARVLAWDLDGQVITGPAEWAGQSLTTGFRERTEAIEIGPAEHATVLRRAVMVAGGRTALPPLPRDRSRPAVCHTYQPGQREIAERMANSRRNWETSSEGMLSQVEETPR